MYKLIVDMGKPYEETYKGEQELFNALKRISELAEDAPYLDLFIDVDGEDKTEAVMERFWDWVRTNE